jgi:hypothetical protein
MTDDPSTRRSDDPAIGTVAREGPAPVDADAPARRLGLLDGKIHVPEDFDDPLPDEILAEFEEC